MNHVVEVFGRWNWFGVSSRRQTGSQTAIFYEVTCSCGSGIKKWVIPRYLKLGTSSSCGCIQRECASKRLKDLRAKQSKHRKKHPLYNTWSGIHQRCYNEKATGYRYYGERGIRICEQWHRDNPDGFENFCMHVGERPEGYTIDRIDSRGNYEPGNVRWADKTMQIINKKIYPHCRLTDINEIPQDFGNWHFSGKVNRQYDSGISVRYFEVECRICSVKYWVRKQDLTAGKSTKCQFCAMNAERTRDQRGRYENYFPVDSDHDHRLRSTTTSRNTNPGSCPYAQSDT